MTTAVQPAGGGALERPSAGTLADVIDTILDKGLVIDAFVRVSLVGIELLTIDARIVVASVDTYLRFAEAVNRLDIAEDKQGLPELVGGLEQGGAKRKTKGALEGALESTGETLKDLLGDRKEPSRRGRRDEEE
ncbi:gas vesicle structural protein GvpA [Dactylosporangium sp. CA-092794]|uniref:gas vesicle structural protein GvpA n=1 Tax=Dactylosporangium sp. CA-092794 TaxID=3239929 RepID=UPI003D94F305